MAKMRKLLIIFFVLFFCGFLRVNASQIAEGSGWCSYKVDGARKNLDGSTNNSIPENITIVIDGEAMSSTEYITDATKIYNGSYTSGQEIIWESFGKDGTLTYATKSFDDNFDYGNNKINKCADAIYAHFWPVEKNGLQSQWFDIEYAASSRSKNYVKYSLVSQEEYVQIKTGSCVYNNCKNKSGVDVSGVVQLEVSVSSKLNGYYMNSSYSVLAKDPIEDTDPNAESLESKLFKSGKPACPAYGIVAKSKMYFSNDLNYIKGKSDFDNKEDVFYCTYSESDSTIEDRDQNNSNREQGITTNPNTNQPSFHIGAGSVFDNCDELFGNGETISLLRDVFKAIIIVVPILIIVLSVLDFMKATAASDEKAIKEAQGKFIKRLIIAALIIFLPIILNIILNLLGNAFGVCGVA